MRRSLVHGDSRGAVYVEFLVAFIPVFMSFLAVSQLTLMVLVRIVVEHAAVVGARAAAVIIADAPDAGTLTADKRRDIESAVYLALSPLILHRYLGTIDVRYPATFMAGGAADKESYEPRPAPSRFDAKAVNKTDNMGSFDFVRVRVDAAFLCRMAPVNALICGGALLGSPQKTLSAEAAYPYQGARYELPSSKTSD